MSVYATGGAKLYIGTGAVCETASEYQAETWTEVKEIADVSPFGDESEVIKWLDIGSKRVRKAKGAYDAGDLTLEIARDPADAGQVLLRGSVAEQGHRNFRVLLTDKPSGVGATASTIYFPALVSAGKTALGGANDITKQSFTLAITDEPITVIASAGA